LAHFSMTSTSNQGARAPCNDLGGVRFGNQAKLPAAGQITMMWCSTPERYPADARRAVHWVFLDQKDFGIKSTRIAQ